MSRKVYIKVKVNLILNINDGVEVGDIVNELEYLFKDTTGSADIVDTEILDWEVTDSK